MTGRDVNFTEVDYRAIADIWNAMYPDYLATPEVKEERPDKINWHRYVLALDGAPKGFGVFLTSTSSYHPQAFWVTNVVVPAHHGKGYGKAREQAIMTGVAPFNTKLYSFSREDLPRKTRFLTRGYQEVMRSYESQLDVAGFDGCPYEGQQLLDEGIALKTYSEIADDSQCEQNISELHDTRDEDVPRTASYTIPSFDEFAKRHWLATNFLPEGCFLAVANGAYVGLS